VEKFSDFCVKDPKSGEIFRADHLVKEVLEARLMGHREASGQANTGAEKDSKKKKLIKTKQVAVKLDDKEALEYDEILAQLDNYDGPALGMLLAVSLYE
jgi:glycyl-tRNA synthetase